MKEITRLAGEMCDFIREKVPNEHGFFRTEAYDVKTLEWSSENCDPDDVGDFAPFMVWYDMVTGGRENIEWVRNQVSMLNSGMMQRSGFYYPFSINGAGLKKYDIFPVYPQNHVDTLLGMNLLHRLTRDKLYLESAGRISSAIMRYANRAFNMNPGLPFLTNSRSPGLPTGINLVPCMFDADGE